MGKAPPACVRHYRPNRTSGCGSRVYVYAGLKADEDLRVAANQERRQSATDLYAQFGEATAWTAPELLTIGQARIEGFLRTDSGLAKFRFQLMDALRQAPHTLSPEGETLLAAASAPLAGPGDIRNQLASSDLPYPTVTLSGGTTARLDQQGYTLNRDAPVRADRKLVLDRFFASIGQFENSFGTALAAQVKGEMFQAKARRYGSALEAALSVPGFRKPSTARSLRNQRRPAGAASLFRAASAHAETAGDRLL